MAYGFGWLVAEMEGRAKQFHVGAINGFAGIIARYPDDAVTVIVLSNQMNIMNPLEIEQTIATIIFAEK